MNMKIIYLSENIDDLQRVYADQAPVQLSKKKDIAAKPEFFWNTEYIFSTWGMPKMTEEEIERFFPKLKAVFYAAGSVRYFAQPFLNRGVQIFSAWAANAVPVAEYVVSQIILANKGFFKTAYITANGEWRKARDLLACYPGNYGAQVGIIGAGMVGKQVIRRLQDYNLKTAVFDPFLSQEEAKELGVQKVSLEEIFFSCQTVSNHLADNTHTKNMIDLRLLSGMLPYATFINTGRGAQVVETDLVTVLKARSDLTAVLDVICQEPPKPDHELLSLPNCVITPHIAGSSGNEVRRMAKYMYEEYENLIAGRPCRFRVTQEILKTMA